MASALILILLEFSDPFPFLGYLIRFRGRVDFIAGFREGRIQDESGAQTRWFLGTNLLALGIIAAGGYRAGSGVPCSRVLFFLDLCSNHLSSFFWAISIISFWNWE